MITTEYEFKGNIIRVHEEERTEEERLIQQRYIEEAAAQFMRKVLETRARKVMEA